MDDGLIQFLVIAVIVIISMMDGAARKRRKEAQRRGRLPEADGTGEVDRFPAAYDDPGEVAQSSEGMVPEDLWKEIAALARGEMPAPRRGDPATRDPISTGDPESDVEEWTAPQQELPQASPPRRVGRERVPWAEGRSDRIGPPAAAGRASPDPQGGYLHPDQAVTHEEHTRVTSPAQALPSEQPHEFVPHPPEPSDEPQEGLRRTQQPSTLLSGFRSGSRRSLRDAIVLAEVLNPPVALRASDRQPPGGE